MAKTTVNIPGVAAFDVPFAMDVAAARSFLASEYPQISGMQDNLVLNGADAVITFSQRTGTKG